MSVKCILCLALLPLTLVACRQQQPVAPGPAGAPAAVQATNAAPAATLTESAFRAGMALDEVKRIQYVGEGGEQLAFSDFVALVQGGRSFSKVVESDKSLAVVTINPIGGAERGPPDPARRVQPLKFRISAELPPLPNKDLDNSPHVLSNGKHYTLLSLFFADCVPCIQEIPALNALAGARENLDVVAVTFETRAVATRFARTRGLQAPIVPDAQAYIDALGVNTYPTLLLVSPEGRLMGVRNAYKVKDQAHGGLAELKAWIDSFQLDG